MSNFSKKIMIAVLSLTIVSVILWQATGGDWYTKYEIVEQVEIKQDPNDPLVAAGFYDNETVTETVTRDEFRFGLLPTPAGLFDKHIFSVASTAGPVWVLGFLLIMYDRRRLKKQAAKV